MMFSKKIFFFLLFIFQATISFAQQQKNNVENDQYSAIHWTKAKDSLPDDQTNTMLKMQKGSYGLEVVEADSVVSMERILKDTFLARRKGEVLIRVRSIHLRKTACIISGWEQARAYRDMI